MELAAVAAVLAAMGGVLKLVLDHLNRQDNSHNAAIEKMQTRQEVFLGNHMSNNTKAMQDTAAALKQLAEGVDILHQDNREQRARLVWDDRNVTRKVEEQNMSSLAKRLDALEVFQQGEEDSHE